VRILPMGNDLVLEIEDDGCGFDPAAGHPGHLGLRSMAERLAEIGGTLELHSAPGRPTIVRAVVPDALTTEVAADD
jgi:signal transduction histidine kinase